MYKIIPLVEVRYAGCLPDGKPVYVYKLDLHHLFQIAALVGIGYVYAVPWERALVPLRKWARYVIWELRGIVPSVSVVHP
jgi:hypothetical protein